MSPPRSDGTGVMILRLWIEPNHEKGLRARMTQTTGAVSTSRSVVVASSKDAVCAAVRQWIEAFEESDGGERPTPATVR
ncbi:MAG: hypothetical protein MUP92_01765 [Actinobacteria bacterium]|nr:hypothetical protein [Actinomycetota bacterium]